MKKIIPALLLCILLFSCDKNHKNVTASGADRQEMIAATRPSSNTADLLSMDVAAPDSSGNPANIILQGTLPGQNTDWDKKIIKTADVKIEVKDFKVFNSMVHNDAKRYGAYIASEDQNESNEKKELTISIKVPVDQFENLLNELPDNSGKIIEKKISSEDVTAEVVDTRSRLQAKEQVRLKYLEFLKQAKNMEDVLKVQSEINNLQEEMEAASGRINYLSHQSSYSTINLTFYQLLPGYDQGNETPGFSTRIANAFRSGANFIAEIFIGIISVWPLCLLIFFIWLLWKKNAFKTAAPKENL